MRLLFDFDSKLLNLLNVQFLNMFLVLKKFFMTFGNFFKIYWQFFSRIPVLDCIKVLFGKGPFFNMLLHAKLKYQVNGHIKFSILNLLD